MPTSRSQHTRERSAGALAWWAAPGSERCPVCLLTYHVETEYRCAACDGPLCPDCAASRVEVAVELVCLDCEREGGDR